MTKKERQILMECIDLKIRIALLRNKPFVLGYFWRNELEISKLELKLYNLEEKLNKG